MKKQFPIYLLLIIICSIGFSPMYSQQLVWEYEVETPYSNSPGFFWVDKDGNGFYNINRANLKHPNRFGKHYLLLSLNENGRFEGAYHVKDCASSTALLPFKNDLFLSTGNNCIGNDRVSYDTRIFNKAGELVTTRKAFDGFKYAKIKGENGYTFFSDKLGFTNYEPMTIGHVDWNFKFSSQTISMSPLKKKGYGITNNFIDPTQLDNGMWIVPFNYGVMKNPSLIITDGIVVAIKKDKIKWTYSYSDKSYRLEQISSYKNKIAVVMRSAKHKSTLFALLDKKGKVLLETMIPVSVIQDVILTEESLIVMTRAKLLVFNLDGELISSFNEYQKDGVVNQRKMEMLPDGDLVITGVRKKNTVIRRIKLGEKQEVEVEELEDELNESVEEDEIEIESMILDDIDEETLSVSVYPNPASLFIKFEVEGSASNDFMIQIVDMSGKNIYSDSFSDASYEIMLNDFLAGAYFYKIVVKEEPKTKVLSGKFIKAN